MIGEYRFFQEFFDGQVVKEESDRYKLFKIMLFSCFSVFGLFLVFAEFCNWAEFILLELGMLWNIYSNIDKKISLFLCVCVALLYFFFASNFDLYANALIYIAAYIPLQMMALSKDYSEGSFVQIKKKISDYNKILFLMFFIGIFATLSLFSFGVNGDYPVLDGLAAALLVCSAVLRNERYFEYYVFRVFALIMAIVLWIITAVEMGTLGTMCIILMYCSYMIFDVVTFFYQHSTYVNQIMIQQEKMQQIANQQLVEEKLNKFNKTKKTESK